MNIAAVIGIAISLAMDAFAVSISCGCVSRRISWKRSFIMAAFFGGFQFFMPIIGWLAGSFLSSVIESFSNFISFGLLAFVGGKMIYESISSEEGCRDADDYFKLSNLVMLSIATSIDALAAGLAYSHLDSGIMFPAAVTGIITFLFSSAGTHAGARIGTMAGRHAETAGGIVLLIISIVLLVKPMIG